MSGHIHAVFLHILADILQTKGGKDSVCYSGKKKFLKERFLQIQMSSSSEQWKE